MKYIKEVVNKCNTIIHVGAHEAQELEFYVSELGAKNIMLLEPNFDKYKTIKKKLD